MANGVTPDGFVRPRLPEIRTAIIDDLRAKLSAQGLPSDIETRPDSVFGVLIGTFAEREAALWEEAEGVYYSKYPGSAIGAQLDNAASFTGVVRRAAEKSQCYVVCYGAPGTTVPQGSQVRNSATQGLWETTTAVTIGLAAITQATIVPLVQNSAAYTVTIDSTDYTYTSDADATTAEILSGIVAALAGAPVTATSDGSAVTITSGSTVALALTANLTASEIGTRVLAETTTARHEGADPGDIDTIVTLVSGWTRVANLKPASPGRAAETDAELRDRYRLGVYQLGAATLPAIKANLLNEIEGLTALEVFVNDTDSAANGRDPHSIQVVIDGGIEDEIAAAIYKYKGAGIGTNGAIVKTVASAEGNQTIKFDRSDPVYIWVKVAVTLLANSQEPFPPDGYAKIKQAVLDEGALCGIGTDVVTQRFHAKIYRVPGIASVDITFATSTTAAGPPGSYTAGNVTIADVERALFDAVRVTVT